MRTPLLCLLALAPISLACSGLGSEPELPVTASASTEPPAQATVPAEGGGEAAEAAAAGSTETVASAATAAQEAREYAGTWLGLCERMADCGCNPMTTPATCARAAESSYEAGIEMARSFGTPEAMLATMAVTEDQLFMGANSDCSMVCSGEGPGSVVHGGMNSGGGVEARSEVEAGGAVIRAEATAGPDGAAVEIEHDGW